MAFEQDGQKIIQIDTYGSAARKLKGKVSQSIQLNRESAALLLDLIKRHFG